MRICFAILLRRVGKKRVHFNIIWQEKCVAFYNGQRPHQRIQQQIPKPGESEKTGGAVA
jgi:hypothetical protein